MTNYLAIATLAKADDPEFVGIAQARFWGKVNKTDFCWNWIGGKYNTGYGQFWYFGRCSPAHLLSWEWVNGKVPSGLQIDHLCRNRACVNPSHLEAVTQRENILRSNAPCAISVRTNKCKRGHEFTPMNTYIRQNGKRSCRWCRAVRGEVKSVRGVEYV